jgi:hypothetical protein
MVDVLGRSNILFRELPYLFIYFFTVTVASTKSRVLLLQPLPNLSCLGLSDRQKHPLRYYHLH